MPAYHVNSIISVFTLKTTLIVFITVMSIITFFCYGHDKRAAKHSRRRVPEKRLFALNFLGGSLGGWLGMYFFHHKTKHPSFYIVQFISSLVWCCLLIFIFVYL